MGFQLRAEELMMTIPIRDTVAGEALSMLCTSNTSLQDGDMVMRSPLARVSVLLSSRTELRFSIHMASTGPSSTIHMNSPEVYTFQSHHNSILKSPTFSVTLSVVLSQGKTILQVSLPTLLGVRACVHIASCLAE